MSKLAKGLAGIVLGLTASLSGCITADHNERDLKVISKSRYNAIVARADSKQDYKFEATSRPAIDYEDAEIISKRYGNLPKQKVGVYFIDGNSVERMDGDFSGVNNYPAKVIRRIETSIPIDTVSERSKMLIIGGPDKYLVAGDIAQNNQMANNCGIVGIGSLPNSDGKRDFTIAVKEVTGIDRKFNETRKYDICILFGEEGFRETKKREDWVYVVRVVEDAALGWVAGGARGAIGAAADDLIVGGWGLVEGWKVPDKTFMSSGRRFVGGLEGRSANTYSILDSSKELEARNIIMVNDSRGYVLTKNIDSVRGIKNGVAIEASVEEKNHLEDLLFRALRVATRADCSSGGGGGGSKSGGGRSGGAGGNGSAGGGSHGGSSGGQ